MAFGGEFAVNEATVNTTWNSFERIYWKYYLKLEKEFLEVIDFVEFVPENYGVYSIKLMQLLLSIGSEVDAVMREICQIADTERSSIADYSKIILKRYPTLQSQRVCVFRSNQILSPFQEWNLESPSQSLPFWNAYNAVKHHRVVEYSQASLESVANGMAALFILSMYRLDEIYTEMGNCQQNIPNVESTLFYLENWTFKFKFSLVKNHYQIIDDDEKNVILPS
jgi:hypothetical protein